MRAKVFVLVLGPFCNWRLKIMKETLDIVIYCNLIGREECRIGRIVLSFSIFYPFTWVKRNFYKISFVYVFFNCFFNFN